MEKEITSLSSSSINDKQLRTNRGRGAVQLRVMREAPHASVIRTKVGTQGFKTSKVKPRKKK